jgi:hypothetical protein
MAPTIRWRVEVLTGISSRVLADYEARGWLPVAESSDLADYMRSLHLVRFLREHMTPRAMNEVFTLLGAERSNEMPKSATEQIDQAVAVMLHANPRLTKQMAIRQLGAKYPELFEAQRHEGLDKSAAGRQAFAEAQSRCRTLGGGSTALAAASRVVENAEPVRGAEPTPSSSRTMAELARLVAEAKKRNPKLDDVAARKQIFTQRPDLYEHYRRSTTRGAR